jgi:hypothetical protein
MQSFLQLDVLRHEETLCHLLEVAVGLGCCPLQRCQGRLGVFREQHWNRSRRVLAVKEGGVQAPRSQLHGGHVVPAMKIVSTIRSIFLFLLRILVTRHPVMFDPHVPSTCSSHMCPSHALSTCAEHMLFSHVPCTCSLTHRLYCHVLVSTCILPG